MKPSFDLTSKIVYDARKNAKKKKPRPDFFVGELNKEQVSFYNKTKKKKNNVSFKRQSSTSVPLFFWFGK